MGERPKCTLTRLNGMCLVIVLNSHLIVAEDVEHGVPEGGALCEEDGQHEDGAGHVGEAGHDEQADDGVGQPAHEERHRHQDHDARRAALAAGRHRPELDRARRSCVLKTTTYGYMSNSHCIALGWGWVRGGGLNF